VRLLLDEMISPRLARELRERGHDVQAIKRDRPDLEGLPDIEIVWLTAAERRAVVTNDVADFAPLHERLLATGGEHFGMVFTDDAVLPRNREHIAEWVDALSGLLDAHSGDDALLNRVHYLS